MKRIILAAVLISGISPAIAQVALTPHWDTSKFPGQSSAKIQARPVKTKTTAQLQQEANEGWAYARKLHPSWGK
jgi:hypothetical protein